MVTTADIGCIPTSWLISGNTNSIHREIITHKETQQQDTLQTALEAAIDKKADDIIVLELEDICSFSDRFLICTGNSTRQNQTIANEINERLQQSGVRATHIEGHSEGEWILIDYLDFVVHIFTKRAREFYNLERLWRHGKRRQGYDFIEPS